MRASSDNLFTGFADRSLDEFGIGVVGDLHLEPGQMHLFDNAASQIKAALSGIGNGSRLVQLGDVGGYNHKPGSAGCFQSTLSYLQQFGMPAALVTGNHDLEGSEFETDEDNLAAWTQVFGQPHYWAVDLGRVLCLGLSSVRFRSNKDSVHEVFIDQEQLRWFEEQLANSEGRPVFVFTHAPPMGCGLKVVESVHVKNRCAWLNHSNNPEVFIDLVRRFQNIKLWFSGHYHLSQNYTDSIATAGSCAFVQTGVIGECDRDGYHQSRIVRGDSKGYSVSTYNHASGQERVDIEQKWHSQTPATVAWLSSQPPSKWPAALAFHQGCLLSDLAPTDREGCAIRQGEAWFGIGPGKALRLMRDGLLVEYDTNYRAAIGVVSMDIGRSNSVAMVDRSSSEVDCMASSAKTPASDGSEVHQVHIRDPQGNTIKRIDKNSDNGFYQIFQPNKWRARKEKEAKAQREALASA